MLKSLEAKSITAVTLLLAIAILLLAAGNRILPDSTKPLPEGAREAVDRECVGQEFKVLKIYPATKNFDTPASVKVKCSDGRIVTVSYGPVS